MIHRQKDLDMVEAHVSAFKLKTQEMASLKTAWAIQQRKPVLDQQTQAHYISLEI